MASPSPKPPPQNQPEKQVQAKQKFEYDPEEYTLRKRLSRKLPKRINDVYINRKTDSKAQFARCQRLLEAGNKELYLHGLGAAVNRAANLALQLKENGQGLIDLAVNTSTVDLVDDLDPEQDDLEPKTRSRNSSAIHIKVYRVDPSTGKEAQNTTPTSQMDTGGR